MNEAMIEAALLSVEEAELFHDGISADLHDEGVHDIARAYMRGRIDACQEIRDELKLAKLRQVPAQESGR